MDGVPPWLFGALSALIAVVGLPILVWRYRIDAERRKAELRNREFTSVRRILRSDRAQLSKEAMSLYAPAPGVPGTSLLFSGASLPLAPIPANEVQLVLGDHSGGWDQLVARLKPMWPSGPDGTRTRTYAEAIALNPPKTFYNGPTYRLLGIESSETGPILSVGAAHYFDYLDTCEGIAFEFTRDRERRRHARPSKPDDRSASRRAAGEPFAFEHRCASIGVSTLTLVQRPGGAEFWMHFRDSTLVAAAQGTWHVMPAGEFQPTSIAPLHADLVADLDVWRNIAREFAEEFLGLADLNRELGRPLDFRTSRPLSHLEQGRHDGRARPFMLGIGIDPLNLKAELLAALVIDGSLFDDVVGTPGDRNLEGKIVGPHPFTRANVDRFLAEPTLLPAGAGVLHLGWTHRGVLLGMP